MYWQNDTKSVDNSVTTLYGVTKLGFCVFNVIELYQKDVGNKQKGIQII